MLAATVVVHCTFTKDISNDENVGSVKQCSEIKLLMNTIYHGMYSVHDGAFITSLISGPTFGACVSPVSVVIIAILAAVKRDR